MKAGARAALPLLGLAGFLAVWQTLVVVTRPAPLRRVTLAFSSPRADSCCAVVLGTSGEVLGQAWLGVGPTRIATSAGTLRLWLGALQPTLAALPPDADARLGPLLDAAQRDFGGGLEPSPVPARGSLDAEKEAMARAARLQMEKLRHPTWLPSPIAALTALATMVRSGEMLRHVVASLFRVGCGFTLAVVLGVPFGLALGSLAWLSAVANTVIQCLRPISPIAWLPVATLALGGGDPAAIFLIFLAAFFPVTVSTAAAVATVDLKYRRSALNFGVRGLALARDVIFPATLPSILTALRIGLGIAWVVVVAAEMLGVESGLGFLVLDARNQLRYDRVVAAMIVIGLIGLGLDTVVRRLEQAELERRGLVAR